MRAGGSIRSYRSFGYRSFGCRRYSAALNIPGRRRWLSPGSTPISLDGSSYRSGDDMATANLSTESINIYTRILLASYVGVNRNEIIIAKSSLRPNRYQSWRSIIFISRSRRALSVTISFDDRFDLNSKLFKWIS